MLLSILQRIAAVRIGEHRSAHVSFLTVLLLSRMATRTGARRTIYYTKQLSGPENSYARTHQYLGEWKDNQWEGKGTLEKTNGTRYVGEWKGGLRHGTGTLKDRHAAGKQCCWNWCPAARCQHLRVAARSRACWSQQVSGELTQIRPAAPRKPQSG